MKKQAFTLVELIVVITILAILATIGFVSFSGYLAGTRDTNRIAQIKAMSDSLELYRTKKDLPIPDDKVDIKAGATTIAYQGYIGANVLETIEYTEKGLDPKDKTYFSYYLTKDKKYFQLLSFLEEANTDVVAFNSNLINSTQAVDYSARVPHVKGKKLGILTDSENTPIQEVTSITASGYLDLSDVGSTTYQAIISDDEIVSGSGTTLSAMNPSGSCKRIKQINGGNADGTYTIDPAGDGVGFEVYCDMTTDGGGWTLIASSPATGNWFGGNSSVSGVGFNSNYSYGTYLSSGNIGNYYLNFSSLQDTISNFLFKTGNNNYWMVLQESDVQKNQEITAGNSVDILNDSGNLSGIAGESYVLSRLSHPEDPWINSGDIHTSGMDYFWGEANTTANTTFKNNNGGTHVFVR